MSTPTAWLHMRLDEMCARVTAEAAAKADRVLADMDEYAELPYDARRRTGYTQTHYPYSTWYLRRIIFPQLMADLDALGGGAS